MNKLKKWFIFFLLVSVTVTCSNTFALKNEDSSNTETPREIVSLREEYTKHYDNG